MAPVDTSPGTLSAQDYYRLIRAQIEHEDNLIAQRLSWFVAEAQSFLFSAYAISLNAPAVPLWEQFSRQTKLLNVMIPVVAILICVVIYLTLLGGIIAALRNLRTGAGPARPGRCHSPLAAGAGKDRHSNHGPRHAPALTSDDRLRVAGAAAALCASDLANIAKTRDARRLCRHTLATFAFRLLSFLAAPFIRIFVPLERVAKILLPHDGVVDQLARRPPGRGLCLP